MSDGPPAEGGAASLFANPFALLGANLADGRQRLGELADQRSLQLDPDVCQRARADLTNPRTRLLAELSWLPGMSGECVQDLLGTLRSDPRQACSVEGLPPLAHCNLLASALELGAIDRTAGQTAATLLVLAQQADLIDADTVMATLNEARALAGFAVIRSRELVVTELSERRRWYRRVVESAIEGLSSAVSGSTITELVRLGTAGGMHRAPEIVDAVVDRYALRVQARLEAAAQRTGRLVGRLRRALGSSVSLEQTLVEELAAEGRAWATATEAIQQSYRARGMTHRLSRAVMTAIHEVAMDALTQYSRIEVAQHLLEVVRDAFGALPGAVELAAKGLRTIDDMATARASVAMWRELQDAASKVTGGAEADPLRALELATEFERKASATLEVLPDDKLRRDGRRLAASVLLGCIVAYGNATGRWADCRDVLVRTGELAVDDSVRKRVAECVALARITDESTPGFVPVSAPPRLVSVHGIGTTLLGGYEANPATGSFIATQFLTLLFLPLWPLARYRVAKAGSSYRYIARGPVEWLDRAICGAIVLVLLGLGLAWR